MKEDNIETITPSQFVNIGWFALLVLTFMLMEEFRTTFILFFLIGIGLICIWKFLYIECWRYTFDDELGVVMQKKGVFSVEIIEVQYFRIKSVRVWRPFLYRLVGLSTIEIITSEPFVPYLTIYAVNDGEKLAARLKELAKIWRRKNKVKESDFHMF